MTVNLIPFVYCKDVQLHVLILCTPHPMWGYVLLLLCHVMCSHPPKAWDSHHVVVVVVGVCQEVISVFGKAVMILWVLFIYLFSLPFPSSIALEFMFREYHPPSHFSQKTTCFIINSCTHTHTHTEIYTTHLPHSHPQPPILYIFRNPATSSFRTHRPTNPSQLLQRQPLWAAWTHPQH